MREVLCQSLTVSTNILRNKCIGLIWIGNNHQKLHEVVKRDEDIVTSTSVVWVTNPVPVAIVWVNEEGTPVSTEYNTEYTYAPIEAATSAPAAAVDITPTPSPAAPTTPDTPPAPSSSAVAPPPASSAATAAASNAAPSQDPGARVAPGGGNTGSGSTSSGTSGYGICYDLIGDDTQCKTPSAMDSDLSMLKSQGYGIVRSYDIGCDLGAFSSAAANNGMKVIVGLNSVSNVAGDMDTLIGSINGNWDTVDTVNVGNEQVNTNAATPAQVVAAIGTARSKLGAAGFSGSVVTVDVFTTLIANPSLCAASDYCAANAHGFFDSDLQASGDGDWLIQQYNQIGAANNGKRVVITESGWPYAGNSNGAAIPSPANQQAAISSIKQAFAGMPGSLFVFEAYDANWKSPGSMGIEQYFGIFGH